MQMFRLIFVDFERLSPCFLFFNYVECYSTYCKGKRFRTSPHF